MNHKELLETIDNFIKNNIYQYALMINGEWGSGKTHFIMHELIPHINGTQYKDANKTERTKTVNYISLYGKRDTAGITDSLCNQAYKDWLEKVSNSERTKKIFKKDKIIDNSSKPFQIITTATGSMIKKALDKFIIKESDLEKLIHLIPDFNNHVIIFDDLERCSCDINEVMGYINHFVEHTEAKVIVVANENEIGRSQLNQNRELQLLVTQLQYMANNNEKKGTGQTYSRTNQESAKETTISPKKLEKHRGKLFDNNAKYRRIKEKVIGKTITYEPDLKVIFQTLINKCIDNEQLKTALNHELDTLIDYANIDEHKNIRTFQFFLDRINTVFTLINNQYNTLHFALIDYCYRSSIRWNKGEAPAKWEKTEEYGMQYFNDSLALSNRLTGFRFIDEFIQKGQIEKEHTNAVLSQFAKKVEEEGDLTNDPYQRIKDWYYSEDEDVKQWIEGIIEKVEDDTYSTLLYPDLIKNLASIKSYGVFETQTGKAIHSIGEHLKIMDINKIKPFDQERFMIEGEARKIYLEVMGNLQKTYDERINEKTKETYQRIITDHNADWTKEILDLIGNDKTIEGWSAIYWIEPEQLLQRLAASNNKELDNFRVILQRTYGTSVYYPNMKDDHNHLLKIKTEIEKIDKTQFGDIKKQILKWIQGDIERYLNRFPALGQDD